MSCRSRGRGYGLFQVGRVREALINSSTLLQDLRSAVARRGSLARHHAREQSGSDPGGSPAARRGNGRVR